MKSTIIWTLIAVIFLGHASAQSATLGGSVVLQRTGEPLPFTALRIWKERNCISGAMFVHQDTLSTDENGLFNLTDLEAGNYQIDVLSSNQYLPEAYDNVSPYISNRITTVTLEADEVRNDINFEVDERPFYFANVHLEPIDLLNSGGMGKAILTVMNTTAREKDMRFWFTLEIKREDGSRFDDTTSFVPVGITRDFYTLVPGSNTIELDVVLPEGIGEYADLNYTITGGRNRWHPLLPAWNNTPRMNIVMYPFCFEPIVIPTTFINSAILINFPAP